MMNKKEGSNVRDELKYPIVFALQKMQKKRMKIIIVLMKRIVAILMIGLHGVDSD